jgi:hypothetical protein
MTGATAPAKGCAGRDACLHLLDGEIGHDESAAAPAMPAVLLRGRAAPLVQRERVALELAKHSGFRDRVVGPALQQRGDPAFQHVDAVACD